MSSRYSKLSGHPIIGVVTKGYKVCAGFMDKQTYRAETRLVGHRSLALVINLTNRLYLLTILVHQSLKQ